MNHHAAMLHGYAIGMKPAFVITKCRYPTKILYLVLDQVLCISYESHRKRLQDVYLHHIIPQWSFGTV